MKKDIQAHIDSCLQCQIRKKSTAKPTPLQPLPTTDQPNQRIHIDLFGPLKTSAQGNKMVLVMTDAFTKYFLFLDLRLFCDPRLSCGMAKINNK